MKGKFQFNLKLTNERFNSKKASIGDLKSAYLAAFSLYGYSYIMRKELDIVRQQIQNPNENLIEYHSYLLPIKEKINFKMMYELFQPLSALMIQIDDRLVFLPPTTSVKNFYNNSFFKSKIQPNNFKYKAAYPFPERLLMISDLIDYIRSTSTPYNLFIVGNRGI